MKPANTAVAACGSIPVNSWSKIRGRAQIVQVGGHPRIKILRRIGGQPGPANEVRREVFIGRRKAAQRRRRDRSSEVAQRTDGGADLAGDPRGARVPTLDVLVDQHHPLAVIEAAKQAGDGGGRGHPGGDVGLGARQFDGAQVAPEQG